MGNFSSWEKPNKKHCRTVSYDYSSRAKEPQNGADFFTELKRRFQWLEEQNANLIEENKELKQRNEFLENELKEIKELDDK